jgi:hypothetical protein
VPIFILYRQEPGLEIEQWPLVTRVNDVTSAMTLAKQAAGDRNVPVHGQPRHRLVITTRQRRRAT